MREIGEPTVIVHNLPATPEEAQRNKENLKAAVEKICSRVNGFETKVSIFRNDGNKEN